MLINAITYTIEFQKRGLPHVHILLWISQEDKWTTVSDIDMIISAEIPDKKLDQIGYEAVVTYMMHGPCGFANPKSPCMSNGKCSKFFLKQFQDQTDINENGFSIYQRRDTSATTVKNDIELDNRFVVPHNVDLTIKYQAHINLEICS